MHKAIPVNQYHLSIDELEHNMGRLAHHIDSLQYEFLLNLREFNERGGWLRSGSKNCAQWLEWRYDLTAPTAREKVRVALALKDLVLISEAFSKGVLAYSKVRALTRVSTADNEAEMLAMAMQLTATQLDQYCRKKRNGSLESTGMARQSQCSRSYQSWPNHEKGTVSIALELPAEEAALVEKALEKMIQDLDDSNAGFTVAPDEEYSWSAMQADAVVNLVKHYLTPEVKTPDSAESVRSQQSSPAADHYQVMIHVDQTALAGQGGSADLPIETVKRLCCDGSVIGIVENDQGEPLSVGRKHRTVTTAIRRALWARDGGCVFPGCGHTRFVDIHHIVHWADGGETSVKNCMLLCSTHNKLVHEGQFTIKTDYAGQLYFTRRDGRVVPNCGYQATDWQDIDVDCDGNSVDSAESGFEHNSKPKETVNLVNELKADYCVIH